MFILVGYFLILLVSFYLLARICDEYFVSSLEKIANRLKMSSDAAGATLMAMGSSAPELFVAIIALVKPGEHASIGAGTIVGSALFNILVIIGASAIVRKAILAWQPVVRDTIFYSLSIIILIFSFMDGKIVVWEALVFVLLYVVYIFTVINWSKVFPYKETNPFSESEEMIQENKLPRPLGRGIPSGEFVSDKVPTSSEHRFIPPTKRRGGVFAFVENKRSRWKKIFKPFDLILEKMFPSARHYYAVFAVSILFIAGLSWVLVESAVEIARILHISEAIIALTILAAGTSVSDLASSMVVAKKGRGGMAISNAIGSNIFDILIGLGLPWLILLVIAGGVVPISTENLSSSIILLFATVLVIFFLLLVRKWKIGHRAGWFLISLYLLYLVYVIISAS